MTDATRYDVFLSFRGEDTRYTITDHLYAALVRGAVTTFRDNIIDRGQELKPEIDKAIKASEASIIVFSKRFATSTWCLDELSLILEQRSECNHFVLPIFYHVDPSDVRSQKNSFSIEVNTSARNTRWTEANVKRWKTALTKAANLTGLVLKGSETEFVKNIVDIISSKQASKKFQLPLNLVKMDTRYEVMISSWIKQSDANFLVISGMGGGGKTTLARYTVYSNRDKFENISIVEHIGSKGKEQHHFLELQETLLGGVLGEKIKVANRDEGKFYIGKALENNKALIFLDDIVDQPQLVSLLGTGNINKESKILITTRQNNLSEKVSSQYGKCTEYQMSLLDDSESLELFCLNAFGTENPIEDYTELANQVVGYCKGNPLALEVLGSSLSHDISIEHWKSELGKLKKQIHSNIQGVLISSYNSLPYPCEKELFLHIACFLNGEDLDYVEAILERDYSAKSSIKTLTRRCLISISPNQRIMMHPLLQEMGRFIVNQESPKDPGERSRVWDSIESHDLLKKQTGSRKVEGLSLDNQELREKKYAFQGLEFETSSFKGMLNLKLLNLKYVQLRGPYEHVSEDLRWLRWIGFNLSTIPSDLSMGNLIALDMSDSCLEEFEPPTDLQSLKILNFKGSKKLLRIGNINKIPKLETLNLWNCHKLVYVCETIGGLKSLSLLNMTGCENVWKNNNSFPMPCSLKRLFLNDCKLEYADNFHLNFSDLYSSIEYLNLGNNLFEFFPNCNHLGNLRVLDLTKCSNLKELISLPSSLAELHVNYCVSLEKVTFESRLFTLQKLGREGCTSLSEVEGFIKLVSVAKFDESDLGHMKWLKQYQDQTMCLIGVDELTKNKSQCLQVLHEFGIVSTSLPDIKIPKMMSDPIEDNTSTSLSFKVPGPNDSKLIGLNVWFKYTIEDDDLAWFAKISTSKGVNLMYNPTVTGRPAFGEVCTWFSYWPIGNNLCVDDEVNVSIFVIRGLQVKECGASHVYTNDEVVDKIYEYNMGWLETLHGDLSAFQLKKGPYYLCRRDYFDKLDVYESTPRWFRILVGDHAEVRGWRMTGRSKRTNLSTGPELEGSYYIEEKSRSPPLVDTNVEMASSIAEETIEDEGREEKFDVFLSFRGEDTRDSFTDHLYAALRGAAIDTFIDNEEIRRGQEVGPEIEEAIKSSRAFIVVLSENYANSRWCLEELWLILEQKRKTKNFVLPVFYQVDPEDVRKQRHSFSIEGSKWTEECVNRWKSALREVGNTTGHIAAGPETELISNIVDTIEKALDLKLFSTPAHLFGIETQAEHIKDNCIPPVIIKITCPIYR